MPPLRIANDESEAASWAAELAKLRRGQERADATLAAIGDGVIRTDALGRIDFLNPAAEELTGWSGAQARGRRTAEIFRLVDETTHQPLADPVTGCLEAGAIVRSAGHALLLSANGQEYSVHHSAAPIRDAAGRAQGVVLVFKDVTELRDLEREMTYLASHDPLTGLLNRREFERRLERAVRSARLEERDHALLYLDLDEFKVINDTCGHLVGDEMLKQVTSLLRTGVRRSDALARLGGDEFGVLLEDCPAPKARQTAEELRRILRSFRFSFREQVFEVGASIGLVPIGPASGDLAQLLSAADAACYVAKDRGRNRVHEYEPDDTGVAQHYGEMRWIQRINSALEERRFRLYYQTIEPVAGGAAEPGGFCEILVRMLDRDGQVIEPAAFVAAAERYHLIGTLDRWVVQTAFGAVAEAQRTGSQTLFAINVSGQSLADETFLPFVLEQLYSRAIDGRRICFEITETAAMSRLGSALRFLSTLREQGCRFALDDFGGGLSSFAYLRNLPVDFLKIDGGLVQDMASDPVKRAMVESINRIGHVMGLRTIAEWVETKKVLDVLREAGVDYAQGFWFSRTEPLIHDR
ncbi:MAG TPA: EAL domain-containing protein [Thermoanaerobaculia bacterium]|nr:EAL domain-containing protein [Thermoanaerobaculia bacterium]